MNQNITPQTMFPSQPAGPDPEMVRLAGRIRSGSGWLNAVAAFSAINSLINAFGGNMYFLVGLGITQLVDAFGLVFAEQVPEMAMIFKGVAVVISLVIAGVLGVLGFFARRGHAWAFILAGLGYGVDTLIVLYFQDFGSTIFHLIALFFMGSGALAAWKLRR